MKVLTETIGRPKVLKEWDSRMVLKTNSKFEQFCTTQFGLLPKYNKRIDLFCHLIWMGGPSVEKQNGINHFGKERELFWTKGKLENQKEKEKEISSSLEHSYNAYQLQKLSY